MNTISRSALLLGMLVAPAVAHAVPVASVNPATGRLTVNNDLGTLGVLFFQTASPNVFTTNMSAYATLPGSFFDSGDLPTAFTYLNFPPGLTVIGNVVTPGMTSCQLGTVARLGFFRTFGVTQEESGFIFCPEPASAALALAGLFPLLMRRRRVLATDPMCGRNLLVRDAEMRS